MMDNLKIKIPKTIHYCWFGRNPLPSLAIKCIASWKKYLPDYEIKEWNEDNFDVNVIPYTREAYAAKKYAFVSVRNNVHIKIILIPFFNRIIGKIFFP